jgi:hypothetical protein
MSLIELKMKRDLELARLLIENYHIYGMPGGNGRARRHRWFAWIVDGYICAVAWLHDNNPFRPIAKRFKLDYESSYFVRRICKTCPGEHLVDFFNAIAEKLKSENAKCIWTFGLDEQTNEIYRRVGFELIGFTPRTNRPVYVKWFIKSN